MIGRRCQSGWSKGFYIGPFGNKSAIDGYVERALLLKYNEIVFESTWNAGANWWFNYAGEWQELAQYFQARCKEFHIDFIPLIQGAGWGYGITDQAPMLTTGVWIENERHTLSHSSPTPLEKRNVVTNASAPILVTDLDGRVVYSADSDFTILPKLSPSPPSSKEDPTPLHHSRRRSRKKRFV